MTRTSESNGKTEQAPLVEWGTPRPFVMAKEEVEQLRRIVLEYGFRLEPGPKKGDFEILPGAAGLKGEWGLHYYPSQGRMFTFGMDIVRESIEKTGFRALRWSDEIGVSNHQEAIMGLDVLLTTLRVAGRAPTLA